MRVDIFSGTITWLIIAIASYNLPSPLLDTAKGVSCVTPKRVAYSCIIATFTVLGMFVLEKIGI